SEHRHSEHVNALIVSRVDSDLTEIKRARIEVARPGPFFAAIFGAENAARPAVDLAYVHRATLIALHNRHHHFGLARCHRQTDAPGLARQSAREFLPGRAAVGALENAADIVAVGRDHAVGKRPWRPLSGIERGVDRLRIRRIEHYIAAAGAGVV